MERTGAVIAGGGQAGPSAPDHPSRDDAVAYLEAYAVALRRRPHLGEPVERAVRDRGLWRAARRLRFGDVERNALRFAPTGPAARWRNAPASALRRG